MSHFDPGCVKTCTSQVSAELFSLSSSLSSGRKHFWFSNLRNRDGISTRRLNIGVFTRPRPVSDIGPRGSLILDVDYAALSTRPSISLHTATKSIGLVRSASAPPSKAFLLVLSSP